VAKRAFLLCLVFFVFAGLFVACAVLNTLNSNLGLWFELASVWALAAKPVFTAVVLATMPSADGQPFDPFLPLPYDMRELQLIDGAGAAQGQGLHSIPLNVHERPEGVRERVESMGGADDHRKLMM
jgi:hypothetical protein